jgi:adiponectin receptor
MAAITGEAHAAIIGEAHAAIIGEAHAAIIGEAHAAPEHLRDNEYIKTGYRINFSTSKRILRSLFMVHNESVNVWTHLLGALLFVFLFWHSMLMLGYSPPTTTTELSSASNQTKLQEWREFLEDKLEASKSTLMNLEEQAQNYTHEIEHHLADWYNELQIEAEDFKVDTYAKFHHLQSKLENLSQSVVQSFGLEEWKPIDRWPMLVFIFSALFCLGCSVICHLFSAHSPDVCSMVCRLDYAGISILLAGSYFPIIFYIFYCDTALIWIYLSCISVSSIIVFIMAMAPFFQTAKFRTARGLSFLGLGLLGVFPLTHMLFIPHIISHFQIAIVWFLLMGACYIIGVGFYILRIPERFYPGKFDLWGSSHNIWHLFVLAAVLCHYVGSRWSFYLRHEATCAAY